MTSLGLFALVITISTIFGIVNSKTLRMPFTIGILSISIIFSVVLVLADKFVPWPVLQWVKETLARIDMGRMLLDGALSFLLFAGAQSVDLRAMSERKFSVLALALFGTVFAVILFALGIGIAFALAGLVVAPVWCVVLGAILAPTDPVSVVGMLRRLGLPPQLQALFAGESLFNDGVAVAVFTVALDMAVQSHMPTMFDLGHIFLLEVGGGILTGLAGGWVAQKAIGIVDDAHLELLITLALCTGVYSLCGAWGMSGPIAAVTAGLFIAAPRTQSKITETGRKTLHIFWELADEILNALLFVLMGFAILEVTFSTSLLVASLIALPLSLLVRAASVFLATLPVYLRGQGRASVLTVLTWGGLRGGISVSLALGLPPGPEHDILLGVCYSVVVFTILVQGLTMEAVVKRFSFS